jgi:hypothetical protein
MEPLDQTKMEKARALYDGAMEKIETLRQLKPFLIDLSLRENPVGDRVGQTLQEKLAILPKMRQFGFDNILLGTLDYSYPNELEVDDDFMMYLRDHNIDMRGGFVFTQIGLMNAEGQFTPDPSMLKMQAYGVPNSLHEIYLSKHGMEGQYDRDTLRRSVVASIQWMNQHVRGEDGGRPRLFINIVDGCDAFAEDPEFACEIIALLARQDIEGISIEDDRGTYLPFQVGAFIAMARTFLPPPRKILVHMHAGGGFENASLIEALLNGADGAWGGLPKSAAIIGHASLGELIANLVRTGNPHMAETYQLQNLLPLATSLQVQDQERPVPDDYPILGNNAYRLPLSFFRQVEGRFMDLVPEAIGGNYRYRIAPVVSDPAVIAGRLAEVTGRRPEEFSQAVLEQMVFLMRRDLRAGKRIIYDEPENLLKLYARATVSV